MDVIIVVAAAVLDWWQFDGGITSFGISSCIGIGIGISNIIIIGSSSNHSCSRVKGWRRSSLCIRRSDKGFVVLAKVVAAVVVVVLAIAVIIVKVCS